MENNVHTQGRIIFRANGDANSYALLDESGNWWLSVLMNGEQMTARQEANLRRLAACWNAFVGMPTEAPEHLAAIGGVQRLTNDTTALMSERDQLRAELAKLKTAC